MNILEKYTLKGSFADYISDALAADFGEENGLSEFVDIVLNNLSFDYNNVNDIGDEQQAKAALLIFDELMRLPKSPSPDKELTHIHKNAIQLAIRNGVYTAVRHLKNEQNHQ